MATSFPIHDPSDEQLAATLAQREHSGPAAQAAQDAFRDLYERHARKLLAFLATRVHRNDLEDVHQEVWERIWKHLPEGFHGGNFRAWLYQIARNYIVDQGRKKRLDQIPEADELPEARSSQPEEVLMEQERTVILKRCLEQLEIRAAELVRARLAGESYEEACPRLGLKPEHAHKLFHQAKTQLQTCVQRATA
jgi:RNA polymerase sigma-70 factor (ECF subfamily)